MNNAQKPWIITIPINRTLIFLLCIIYSICPAFVYLYLNDIMLFKSLELFKLIILCCSAGLIVFAINFIWTLIVFQAVLILAARKLRKNKPDLRVRRSGRILGFMLQDFTAIIVLLVYTIFIVITLITPSFLANTLFSFSVHLKVFELFYLSVSLLVIAVPFINKPDLVLSQHEFEIIEAEEINVHQEEEEADFTFRV